MADISSYIRIIELAARGEEVRDALVDSLTAINGGIPDTVEDLLTAANARGDFIGPQGPKGDTGAQGPKGDTGAQGSKGDTPELTYDSQPTENSTNLLTSGAVYSALESITPGVSLTEYAYLQLTENEKNNGTVYYVTDRKVICRNGVVYGIPSWNVITYKPTTLTGYGISVDTAPTENSTNPVTSGGVYNAVLAKENTSNKKTEITAASTDMDYPSAKAVWNLFFSMQAEITRLKARVAALENEVNPPTADVQNNILEVYNGDMNGTVLELEGAYVDENNILVFGSSGLNVSNNILEVRSGSMSGTMLEIDGASVDGNNNLTEEGG